MKARILLLAAGIATLTSCSSLYKTGQTPDDVYYSPARPVATYVQNERDDRYDGYQSYQQYQDSYRNDRFLRLSMSMGNPYYMSVYNDYGGFDWRSNVYASYWNSPWNNYWAWNNFYNPYAYSYCTVPIGYGYGYGGGYGGYNKISFSEPKSKPVAFSGRSYSSRPSGTRYVSGSNGAYYNSGTPQRYNNSNSGYSQSNNNSSNNSSYHNNTSTPTRSYTPSSSGSSSSGSSGGGGGGGISRPTRN